MSLRMPAQSVTAQGNYAGSVSRFLAYAIDLAVSTGVFTLALAGISYAVQVVTGKHVSWNRQDLAVTIIFSAYALGVAASLFLVGHVSDWLGRRRILLIAVGVNMAAGLLFLGWPTVPGLIIGRVISGKYRFAGRRYVAAQTETE